jgi:hypothetical protein
VENAYVGPGYFQTLKLPLLYGRDFSETDFAGTSRIAVVSEGMARRYWGKPDVVGLRYRHQGSQDSWVEIIGVVGDIKAESLGEEGTPVFYRPLRPGDATRLFLVARSGGNPQPAAAMMQQLFRELNPAVPVIESGTMASHAALSLGLHRAAAGVVGILGLVSLLLAGIGLYGVVAFAVTQRTAEVGIRMALGARAGQVVAMLIREEMALVAAGIAAGLLAALWAGPLIRGLLFGIRPGDPLTLAFVAALLAAVSLLATWLPARHAVRIGPVDALRYR